MTTKISQLPVTQGVGWLSEAQFNREAANVTGLRNGTSGQAYRVYNTWTDASNGEWFEASWAANALTLKTNNNGTGTARTLNIFAGGGTLNLGTGGNTRLTIADSNGNITLTPSGMTTFNNGQVIQVRVVTATGPITVATSDHVVVVNKTVGAASAVSLPGSPATGLVFIIKDGKGDAVANPITITPAAGTIDGAANKVVNTAYGSVKLTYSGTEWLSIP